MTNREKVREVEAEVARPLHGPIVDEICRRSNGVHPLRQVSAIPDGYQKNRSQCWRLPLRRAREFDRLGLIGCLHLPMLGKHGDGSLRSKTVVWATERGRAYVELCRAAAREANLSWHEQPYGDLMDATYLTWQAEWLERRDRFREALFNMEPPAIPRTGNPDDEDQ